MKNITRAFALALGAAVVSAPALAADVVYQEPMAPAAPMDLPPVNTWSGPYAGVSAGYGFENSVRDRATGAETNEDGFVGGVFGGFQQQNGQFVYGAEADVNYTDFNGAVAIAPGQAIGTEANIDGSIRGRLGVTVTEDILLYGTAGVAANRQRATLVDATTGASVRDTNAHIGYTVGAGVDARLTDQVFGRLEYRYTDYGSETYDFGGFGGRSIDSDNHRVTVGLGVKF